MTSLICWLARDLLRKPVPAFRDQALHKLNGNTAERSEVGVQRVAFLRKHNTRKRAGEDNVSGLERVPVRTDLVRKPGDAECRMTKHAGGQSSLLDFRIAIHDAAHPAQIDIHRPDWPATHCDARSGAVVSNRVDDFALVLD